MSFIGLFLKSIFIMVLMIAVFLIGIISFIYLRVKRMTKQFHNGTNTNLPTVLPRLLRSPQHNFSCL